MANGYCDDIWLVPFAIVAAINYNRATAMIFNSALRKHSPLVDPTEEQMP